jgi:hypothetical protein
VDEEEEDGKPASLPMGFFDDPEVSPHKDLVITAYPRVSADLHVGTSLGDCFKMMTSSETWRRRSRPICISHVDIHKWSSSCCREA